MNAVIIKQILLILFSASGSIVAIIGLISQQGKRPKIFKPLLIICSVIVVLYTIVGAYLEIINRNQFFAELQINIGEPYLVNVDGTDNDKFVKNANYIIVGAKAGFSLNTSIEIKNVWTGEEFIYHTSGIDSGYRIANFSSGEYDVKIITDEYQVYNERIILDSTNLSWDESKNIWYFTAYMFDDFYDKAVSFDIYLGDVRKYVEYPAFGISSDGMSFYYIFNSKINWTNNGLMAGKYYGYKDVYTVNNAINTSQMPPIVIDKTN